MGVPHPRCKPDPDTDAAEAIPAVLDRFGRELLWPPHRAPIVLVVEDDDDTRMAVCLILKRHGLDTVGAATARQAFELLAIHHVSAVVLDLGLPDEPGEMLCTLLRSDPDTAHLPVVMLTARDSLEEELAGILLGANAYLVKPVRASHLVDRLYDLL